MSGTPTAAGTGTFRVQVKDANGATAEKDFALTITPRSGDATITGRTVYYEGTRPLVGVTVGLSGAATRSTESGADGGYSLKAAPGANYTVTPSRSTDTTANAGVTTADLTFIRRHVLNAAPLDSGYKVLAADANASASVTTADITLLRAVDPESGGDSAGRDVAIRGVGSVLPESGDSVDGPWGQEVRTADR